MDPIEPIFDDLWCLGHGDPKAYNAHSYFAKTPAGGVMAGVPAFVPEVADFLQRSGGLSWIFLAHRDDAGEVAKFKERFGSEVLIHAKEAAGLGCPVRTFDRDFTLADKLKVICTPGHSAGSACLLYEAYDGILFSGDHILISKGSVRPVHFSWTWDWEMQMESAVKILACDFEVVLPGHSPWKNGLKGARPKLERSLSEIESERV